MNYNKRLPFITAVFNYILLQVYFFWPSLIYIALVFQILVFLFVIRQFLRASKRKYSGRWYHYFIWPFNFTFGLVAFSVLIPSTLILQAVFLVYFLLVFYYLKLVYRRLLKPDTFDRPEFDNFSSYANFVSFYFLSSAIYGLQTFLNVNISSLIFAVILFAYLTIFQVYWVNKIDLKKNLHFVLFIVLILTQIAWATSFLTLSFYILGLILAVSYYILIGIVRFYILGTLDARLVSLYLIFGFSSILLVLLTTRWISSG